MAIREINLVPPEVLARRYMLRHLNLWAGCLTLSMLLVTGFYFQRSANIIDLKGTETALSEAGSNLSVRIDEIKQLQTELGTLSREQSILDVVGGSQSYSRILLKLSLLLNEQTWLRSISAISDSARSDSIAVQIIGFSLSNDELGEFMNQLTFDPSFDEVVLKYSREGTIGGAQQEGDESQAVIQFLIECSAL